MIFKVCFFVLSRKASASQEGVAEAADTSWDVSTLGKETDSLDCLVSLCARWQK